MRMLSVIAGIIAALQMGSLSAEPMQVCVGGGDHKDTTDLADKKQKERDFLKKIAGVKATSHEIYVRWSMVEPKQGEYDFSLQDAMMQVDAEAGLKLVPFLVIGPAYVLPEWFYKGAEKAGYVCLEHGKESDIQSLWNPEMPKYVTGMFKAYGKQYRDSTNIEATLLGISGNYGETLVPASEPDWTQDMHGPYHAHKGWWVGDKFAQADFTKAVSQKFSDIESLNEEWATTFTEFAQVKPRLPVDWATTASRHFQSEWMLDSMTKYAKFCMGEAAREITGDKYIVVGGHAPAYHGFDATAQCKDAAKLGIGVRITNENDHFEHNFSVTRIVSSACRQYGTFFSYEPAGAITELGVAGRVFNAVSSGVKQLHWYDNNFQTTAALAKWEECRPFLHMAERKPIVDVAVFYPRRWMDLQEDEALVQMYQDIGALRNAFDLDLADERMLADYLSSGTLPWKYLMVRQDHLEHPQSREIVSRIEASGKCKVVKFSKDIADPNGTRDFLRGVSNRLAPDVGFYKNVYVARMNDGATLFLNHSDQAVELMEAYPQLVKEKRVLSPYSMAEIAGTN